MPRSLSTRSCTCPGLLGLSGGAAKSNGSLPILRWRVVGSGPYASEKVVLLISEYVAPRPPPLKYCSLIEEAVLVVKVTGSVDLEDVSLWLVRAVGRYLLYHRPCIVLEDRLKAFSDRHLENVVSRWSML